MLKWFQDAAVYQWLLDFFAWSSFCYLALKDRRVSSSLLTLTVVLLLDGIMGNYGSFINSFAEVGPVWLVRTAYYGGFVLFDILAIFLIFQAHKAVSLDYKLVARAYLLAYFALAWIQLLRLMERLYLDSDKLKSSYVLFISAINIGTTITGAVVALATLYVCSSNKCSGGAIWKI